MVILISGECIELYAETLIQNDGMYTKNLDGGSYVAKEAGGDMKAVGTGGTYSSSSIRYLESFETAVVTAT
jgi:hypothetical protein